MDMRDPLGPETYSLCSGLESERCGFEMPLRQQRVLSTEYNRHRLNGYHFEGSFLEHTVVYNCRLHFLTGTVYMNMELHSVNESEREAIHLHLFVTSSTATELGNTCRISSSLPVSSFVSLVKVMLISAKTALESLSF
jgi:hypothetical protein